MGTYEKMPDESMSFKKLDKEVLGCLSQELRSVLHTIAPSRLKALEEIRLRAGKPLMLLSCGMELIVDGSGNAVHDSSRAYIVAQAEILRTLELMSENSIYAYQDEIRNGFITLKGGHRVGVAGRIVLDNGCIKNIKDIAGLNIRVSKEVKGCARKILQYVTKNGSEVYNTLIVSPPQCGKTTMLRDLARLLSDGENPAVKGMKVGIVDERSEIAACFKGVPENEVGIRTDVLDGCPKALGMEMLLRTMSPQVVITDEIGNSGDMDAIMQVINSGVKIITSAHGYSISDLRSRREVLKLMEAKVFDRYIVLSGSKGPGTVEEVVDGNTMKVVEKYAV